MRAQKTAALLIVVIRTELQQWFVAGSTENDPVIPLVCSEPGNLKEYVDLSIDEQLSFLRHRIAGAIQRGFDRLYTKDAKAKQILLLIDDEFPSGCPALSQRLGDHFHTWMSRPCVSCYQGSAGRMPATVEQWTCLAGPMEQTERDQWDRSLPMLLDLLDSADCWEHIPTPAPEA